MRKTVRSKDLDPGVVRFYVCEMRTEEVMIKKGRRIIMRRDTVVEKKRTDDRQRLTGVYVRYR